MLQIFNSNNRTLVVYKVSTLQFAFYPHSNGWTNVNWNRLDTTLDNSSPKSSEYRKKIRNDNAKWRNFSSRRICVPTNRLPWAIGSTDEREPCKFHFRRVSFKNDEPFELRLKSTIERKIEGFSVDYRNQVTRLDETERILLILPVDAKPTGVIRAPLLPVKCYASLLPQYPYNTRP